jgi:hypothetical protein
MGIVSIGPRGYYDDHKPKRDGFVEGKYDQAGINDCPT